jgi:hypothetical protein
VPVDMTDRFASNLCSNRPPVLDSATAPET